MKFIIYSDLHRGQTSEILNDPMPTKGDIYLGDIFDIKNTSKKIIDTQIKKQEFFIQKCKLIGSYYVQGNHDLRIDLPLQVKIEKVLFVHGHTICWDQTKVDEWSMKKPIGVGFFRNVTLAIENLYTRGTWKPTQIEINRAVFRSKLFGCGTIVLGHTHTDTIVDFISDGIRIVNVPRGKTEIEL